MDTLEPSQSQHSILAFSDNKGVMRLPGKPLLQISVSSSPINMLRSMAFYSPETTMRNSTSSMTESPNCAPTSTSSTSCFTSQSGTTLPPIPAVPNALTISYVTSGCLMLQYKDAMNLFNIASKRIIALWSLTSTLIDYLAILPLHLRHWPSESFHPKMQVLTGNTYKQSTNISTIIISHHVSLTYKKHGTPT